MQKVDIAELRRLWKAATKGEWTVLVDEHETESDGTVIAGEIAIPEINRMIHSTEWAESTDWQRDLDNAEFIAAAHNALPALLDELEAARLEMRRQASVIAEYKGEVERLVDCIFQGKGIDAAGELGITRENFRAWLRERGEELQAAREEALRLQEVVTAPTYREGLALLAGKDARDRRMRLLGAAEELERIAANWYQEMVAWTATNFEQRAAQLRREAEGK